MDAKQKKDLIRGGIGLAVALVVIYIAFAFFVKQTTGGSSFGKSFERFAVPPESPGAKPEDPTIKFWN